MTECDQGGAIFVTVVRENLSTAEVVSAWRPEGQLLCHWRECRMAAGPGPVAPPPAEHPSLPGERAGRP